MSMNFFLTSLFITISVLLHAQDVSVEKSTYGIQTGLLGFWGYKETRVSNLLALRSEIGFDTEIFGGSFYDRTGIVFVPVLIAEPRYYYNIKNRISRSKKIEKSSANFLSINFRFHPDWFVISNYNNVNIISDFAIIPQWGLRRHFGKHISFETGLGIGYRLLFLKQEGFSNNDGELAVDLRLRFGYTF